MSFKTVYDVLAQSTSNHPDKEALYDGKLRWSYQELKEKTDRLAAALYQIGVQKGDRIIACVPNCNEFVVIYFAIARIGACLIPANTRYQSEELNYIISNSGAKAVFVVEDYDHASMIQSNMGLCNPALKHIFTVRFKKEPFLSFDELIEQGDINHLPELDINSEQDIFSILYTSGTTGKPKGAMLTHLNFVSSAVGTTQQLKADHTDVFLLVVPVFHIFGMVPGILSAIESGAKIVMMERFYPEKALSLIESERITIHHGVPTMFIMELNDPALKKTDLSSLRTGIIAAAPCPPEVIKQIRTEMGCDVIVSFGATETSAGISYTSFDDSDEIRAETVGKSIPGTEIKIVDRNKQELAIGEVGEIICRGPGIMKGYYQMPDKTNEVLDADGWYLTGDLGMIDQHGYLRIVGRQKDLIIRGGFNIYPSEIEDLLYHHPAIMEVALIGLPDRVLGEVTCAVVKRKPDMDLTKEEIISLLKGKVANYKLPDQIVFMDHLPVTASGKIKKIKLKEQLAHQLNL